jgi:hypothetical protein
MRLIEFGDHTIGAHVLQNRSAHGRIAKPLRQPKILLLRDIAELRSMFLVVFVKLGPAAKSGSGSPQQQRREKPQQNEATSP